MARAAMFLSEDSFRLRSQAYAYFADDFSGRDPRATAPSRSGCPTIRATAIRPTNDIAKGETLTGRFVTIPHAERTPACS